jgi:hypothetical protein
MGFARRFYAIIPFDIIFGIAFASFVLCKADVTQEAFVIVMSLSSPSSNKDYGIACSALSILSRSSRILLLWICFDNIPLSILCT